MILKVSNLEKIYRGKVSFKALSDINMEVKKGEFIAIMGPSGSGKSTFLNTISTIDKPTGGSVLIAGRDPYKMNDSQLSTFRRRELGFVFQDFNLIKTLTVGENIILPLTLDNIPLDKMDKRLNEISEFLGISYLLDKRTYEISGGQAQRVAIARAVINEPSILLADEPTGNLDEITAAEITQILQETAHKLNKCVIIVTHSKDVAQKADAVLELKQGILRQVKK